MSRTWTGNYFVDLAFSPSIRRITRWIKTSGYFTHENRSKEFSLILYNKYQYGYITFCGCTISVGSESRFGFTDCKFLRTDIVTRTAILKYLDALAKQHCKSICSNRNLKQIARQLNNPPYDISDSNLTQNLIEKYHDSIY